MGRYKLVEVNRPFVGLYYHVDETGSAAWTVYMDIDTDTSLIPDAADGIGNEELGEGYLGTYPHIEEALSVLSRAWSEYHRRALEKELRLMAQREQKSRQDEAATNELRTARLEATGKRSRKRAAKLD